MKNLEGSVVLVTGGASGIGRATAVRLATEKVRLVLLDSNEAGLKEARREIESMGCDCVIFHADVRDFSRIAEIRDKLQQINLVPDIIINSAGVAVVGRAESIPIEEWRRIIEINLFGCINVIKVFIENMISRRKGHIVNVASGAGLFTVPFQAPYVASKYAVVGLSEALRWELFRYRISVSVVCPGLIKTPIVESVNIVGFDDSVRNFARKTGASPESMAKVIIKGIKKDKFLIIFPRYIAALAFLKRLSWRLAEYAGKLSALIFETLAARHHFTESAQKP